MNLCIIDRDGSWGFYTTKSLTGHRKVDTVATLWHHNIVYNISD